MNNDDDGMIDVTHYVEFPNETGKYWLGIGRIADTNNVYIERFQKMSFTKNITYNNTNEVEKMTIIAKTFRNGQSYLKNNESVSIVETYVNMLRDQYKNSPIVKKDLISLVDGFECITGVKRSRTKSIEL